MLKIMLVEDEANILKGMEETLNWKRFGFEVASTARNGVEGFETYKLNPVDLVITDVRMPECDGLQMIENINSFRERPVEFIVISGYEEFKYAQTAAKLGVKHYLLKPVIKQELYQILKEIKARFAAVQLKSEAYLEKVCQCLLLEQYHTQASIEHDLKQSGLQTSPPYYLLMKHKPHYALAYSPGKAVEFTFQAQSFVLFFQDTGYFTEAEAGGAEEAAKYTISEPFDSLMELPEVHQKLLAKYKEQTAPKKMTDKAAQLLQWIDLILEERYTDPNLGVAAIADTLQKHPNYLSTVFKKQTGKSLAQYLNEFRLEKSKKLLLATDDYIYNIASKAGYVESKYYVSLFKEYTGMTPLEYRNRNYVRKLE